MLQADTKFSKSGQAFLVTGSLLGWFALIVQLYLIIANRTVSVPETVIRYFSFFTIQSNIMVSLCFTLPLISPYSLVGKFLSRPAVLAAVALYIGATGIVYNTILRQLADFHGLQLVVDELLHLVIPVWFLLYWILFSDKSPLTWKHIGQWIIYPTVYCIYSLARGAVTGYYPYPFFNAEHLGYQKVLINCTGMTLLFGLIAVLLIALAKRIRKPTR
jgi:hypothetical protein